MVPETEMTEQERMDAVETLLRIVRTHAKVSINPNLAEGRITLNVSVPYQDAQQVFSLLYGVVNER